MDDAAVSARIREFRLSKHMTQSEFAEAVGVSMQTISNSESGRRPSTLNLINRIAARFDINPDWLLEGSGAMLNLSGDVPETLVPSLISALKVYPDLLKLITALVNRMNISDWTALNNFAKRNADLFERDE